MNIEAARLRKLYQMELLDSPADQDFDEIVHLTSQITNMPISLITLIDSDRQWMKATYGLDVTHTERSAAVCHHTIQGNELFEVENLSADQRFVKNRFVAGNPKLRYYAGIPLTTSDGYRLGALCVLDTKVRKKLSDDQIFAIKALARQTMNHIELRVKNRELSMLHRINKRMISMLGTDISDPATTVCPHALKNFQDYGRIQSEEQFFQTELRPIRDVIIDMIRELYPDAQQKGNSFSLEVAEGDAMPIDAFTLRFIVRNLVHNANKYSEGSEITVRYFHQAGSETTSARHYLSIADKGTGIQPSFLSAFNEGNDMYKVKGTRGEEGTGNGLLFIRYILHKMGGRLHLQSEVGAYTTAIVIL